jgi:6-pyruvoyl-tetrahydropterin synthase
VELSGSVDRETGMLYDFAFISDIVKEYDHQHLNDMPALEGIPTTAENFAHVLCREILNRPPPTGFDSCIVTVYETETSKAICRWTPD